MKNLELLRFTTAQELARAAASQWRDWLRQRPAGGSTSVAISGGRISLSFFEETEKLLRHDREFLANVHFFWADERCVPPDDKESNFRAANDLLFKPLAVDPAQVHRIRGEDEPVHAAESASRDLKRMTAGHGSQTPICDLIFLGMGEDGHTASLFPGETEAMREDQQIYRPVVAPKPPPGRITMGYGVLLAAREVWVLASGKGKEEALEKTLSPHSETPLGRVVKGREKSRFFTDISGSSP